MVARLSRFPLVMARPIAATSSPIRSTPTRGTTEKMAPVRVNAAWKVTKETHRKPGLVSSWRTTPRPGAAPDGGAGRRSGAVAAPGAAAAPPARPGGGPGPRLGELRQGQHPRHQDQRANTKNGARGPARTATSPPMLGPTPTAKAKKPW